MFDFTRYLANRQLSRNSIFAVAQTLISLLCVFGAYRILISHVGIEKVGLWSLLMAGSSLVRLGDFSGGGALARFVAVERSSQKASRPADYIHTVILTIAFLYFVFGVLLFWASEFLIHNNVSSEFVDEALLLAPYAIINICLASLSSALFAGIDGTQRADQRAIIGSVAALLFVVLTFVLVPQLGAKGFGIALIAQQLMMIVTAWIVLRFHIPELGWFPYRWYKDIFRETVAFGMKIQASSLASLLFEPLAKVLLNQWGGLAVLGIYELASKLVVQARALIIAAIQPLISTFAGLRSDEDPRLRRLLVRATSATAWASIAATMAVILASPVFSWLMLGKIETNLILITCALAAGWNINSLCSPIYFAAIGKGIMKWNLLSHVVTGLATLVGGLLLGEQFGTLGVVASMVVGLLIGTAVAMIGNAYSLGVQTIWCELRWPLVTGITTIPVISLAGVLLVYYWFV